MRIINRKDGGVSVISAPAANVAEVVRKWRELQIVKTGDDNFVSVEELRIPATRDFRDAWRKKGSSVAVDMPLAREIHRNHMRVARAPKLAALDVRQLRGENVEAEKQALRDVTNNPTIESAQTPEQLKAVWPGVLK